MSVKQSLIAEAERIGFLSVEDIERVFSVRKGRGRPSTGFDKKAYMKEYMRKKRAEKKQHEKRA